MTTATYATRHQPVTSSIAAQAMANVPSRLRSILRSRRIRAKTGKALMLITAPMNRANGLNATPGSGKAGIQKDRERSPQEQRQHNADMTAEQRSTTVFA
jgi:hypothetical protein